MKRSKMFWPVISITILWFYSCLSHAASTSETSALRYLALGDSYTIGEGVEHDSRWPVLLQNRLNTLGINIETSKIIARTGWRTDDLYDATQTYLKPSISTYDLVTLMIGVNDQFQDVTIDNFSANLETLIEKAIHLANGKNERVLLISIPDWNASPYGQSTGRTGVATEIDDFNTVLKTMATKYNLAFADVTSISRNITPQDFTLDGLHPSQQQYQRWVDEAILPKVKSIL